MGKKGLNIISQGNLLLLLFERIYDNAKREPICRATGIFLIMVMVFLTSVAGLINQPDRYRVRPFLELGELAEGERCLPALCKFGNKGSKRFVLLPREEGFAIQGESLDSCRRKRRALDK